MGVVQHIHIDKSKDSLRVAAVDSADCLALKSLARSVHEEGAFSHIPFSTNKFDEHFKKTIEQTDEYLGLKVELLEKKILGFCFCSLGGYFIGDNSRIVSVNTICVDKSIRSSVLGGKAALRLVRGVELWARHHQADAVLYHVTSGVDVAKVDQFFRRLGMTTLGGNYAMRLL